MTLYSTHESGKNFWFIKFVYHCNGGMDITSMLLVIVTFLRWCIYKYCREVACENAGRVQRLQKTNMASWCIYCTCCKQKVLPPTLDHLQRPVWCPKSRCWVKSENYVIFNTVPSANWKSLHNFQYISLWKVKITKYSGVFAEILKTHMIKSHMNLMILK